MVWYNMKQGHDFIDEIDQYPVQILSRVDQVANFLQAYPVGNFGFKMLNLFVFKTGDVGWGIHIFTFMGIVGLL